MLQAIGIPGSIADKMYRFGKAYGASDQVMLQAIDRADRLVQQCIDYAQTEGWTMHHAVDVMPGPCGKYEFRKKYVSKKFDGHGASIQSLSCVIATAANRRYPPSRSMRTSEPCPDCVIEFCKKYDVKTLLSPYVQTCVKNHKIK